jgi:formamidopyrimidine-DNA glycosylase
MPELPEILLRAREIDSALRGRVIVRAEFAQPKCLNVAPDEFAQRVLGQTIRDATHRGKWVFVTLDRDLLLLSLGMGGEILLHEAGEPLPAKWQAVFYLEGGARLSVHFWWFGYLHLVASDRIAEHTMTAKLGVDPLNSAFTAESLSALLKGRRAVKTVLLDQACIAGIGNLYSHDILFRAGIHPLRPGNSLSAGEIQALWESIRVVLSEAIALGGAHWEQDLYGRRGRFDMACLQVGYKEGQRCPSCGATIERIKTGATAAFVCPACQPTQALADNPKRASTR